MIRSDLPTFLPFSSLNSLFIHLPKWSFKFLLIFSNKKLYIKSILTSIAPPWTLCPRCIQITKRCGSFQSLSSVQLFVTPWTSAHQASLSIINSWSLSNSCPSNLLILCHPLLLLPLIFFSTKKCSGDTISLCRRLSLVVTEVCSLKEDILQRFRKLINIIMALFWFHFVQIHSKLLFLNCLLLYARVT